MEWIILNNPFILLTLIILVLLVCFDKKYQASKGIITIASALCYVMALAFLSVHGAGYHELIVLFLIFLLFNLDSIKNIYPKE